MDQPCSQWVESQRDVSELLCSLWDSVPHGPKAVCGSAVCTDLLVKRPWGRLRVKKMKQLLLTVGSASPFLCAQSWLSHPCPGEGCHVNPKVTQSSLLALVWVSRRASTRCLILISPWWPEGGTCISSLNTDKRVVCFFFFPKKAWMHQILCCCGLPVGHSLFQISASKGRLHLWSSPLRTQHFVL